MLDLVIRPLLVCPFEAIRSPLPAMNWWEGGACNSRAQGWWANQREANDDGWSATQWTGRESCGQQEVDNIRSRGQPRASNVDAESNRSRGRGRGPPNQADRSRGDAEVDDGWSEPSTVQSMLVDGDDSNEADDDPGLDEGVAAGTSSWVEVGSADRILDASLGRGQESQAQ